MAETHVAVAIVTVLTVNVCGKTKYFDTWT